ncbi:uncharacterized protein E0L32_010013 [Thyridium curvatum]|uniref:Uncharacterized protein n=1 Tax=Thyridium curvatum TaxID=1093900 RepID=A0A507AP94_9PEZI|nr:uncharacterized protein E0L32_010013 [Thyridium curvatum]TPX08526.1 hypothetical protein E0L32_010013 [Thyridium curvatum]
MKATFFIIGALAALVAAAPAPAPEPEPAEFDIAAVDGLVARFVEDNVLSKRDCGKCSKGKKLCWSCNPTGGCATNVYKC